MWGGLAKLGVPFGGPNIRTLVYWGSYRVPWETNTIYPDCKTYVPLPTSPCKSFEGDDAKK